MKQTLLFFIIFAALISCRQEQKRAYKSSPGKASQKSNVSEMTNNFYDKSEAFSLPLMDLTIEGEIANPGKVDFSTLEKHTVIVKEALPDSAGSGRFVGAYRYDGFSLFDILNHTILKKANSSEFPPIIDLFIEIENKKGEKVVFSLGRNLLS